ncbi:MAG: MMPL family transporter [Bacteroidales bacterium]|nr:MMPL family transporter [Bacteroidales bacterium]
MNKFFNNILNFRWAILIATLLISAGFAYLMSINSRMETDLDEYMPQDHPAFVYSDQAESWFNINDGIIIAVENKSGIYNAATLDTVKQLTIRLQRLPEIEKKDVTSLYTADNIVGSEGSMDVKSFYKRVPKSEEGLATLRQQVLDNDMVYRRLVSEDETVTVIIAEIKDDVFSQEFYEDILKLAKNSETESINIHVAGRPIVEGTMALLGPADMTRMVPIVILVIVLVLFFTLRSVSGTLVTMMVVFLSTIWAFGLMAAVNIPIYAVSTMIPVMLIAIGVADGIHLYSHLQLFIQKRPDATKKEAILDMLSHMWKPVVMTSITTAVGFVSLLTSQVYPIKYFGIFTAFGVLMAMTFSLIFLPASIMIFGLPRVKVNKHKKQSDNHAFAFGFAARVLKYKSLSIIVTAVLVFASIFGMQKIWIDSSFLDKFEKDSDIVLTDQFINAHFGGTSNVNLILDAEGTKDVFKNPQTLRLIDKMQKEVTGSLREVGNSFSLADYINRMNMVMNADDQEFNRIPDDQNMIAQYLLLYEMSGDPENLNKVVDYDYTKTNVTFQLKGDDSKTINNALELIETFRDDFKKMGISMNYAGSGYKGLVFTDLILEGQIQSIILSLVLIIILIGVMFRSVKIGLISSVPLIITALISFGLMGFLGIPLNSTTALLSSIAIGIGIDYAVHFIQQYKANAAKSNDLLLIAQQTMAHSGRAISFNAIVVISGFMVLLFSVFPPNRELGALVSLNMFTSFIGTVTIMLVLLNITKVFQNKLK